MSGIESLKDVVETLVDGAVQDIVANEPVLDVPLMMARLATDMHADTVRYVFVCTLSVGDDGRAHIEIRTSSAKTRHMVVPIQAALNVLIKDIVDVAMDDEPLN